MVQTSQNGYNANDRSLIGSYPVPGTKLVIHVRKDYGIPTIFQELLRRWNLEVEPLDGPVLDDWSYAERNIRGSSTTLSNHSSGTACDLNAQKHPLGKVGTFTKAQVAAIRRILADFDGVIRWGGDYEGRKDEMHAEINASPARCEALERKILAARKGPEVHTPAPTVQEDDMAQQDVDQLKVQLADLAHKVEALTVLAQQTQDRLGMDVNVDNASRNDLAALSTKLDEVLEHVRAQA